MMNLGSWMNKILIGWGVDPKIANTFDEIIIAALLIVLAVGIDYLCQFIFVGSVRKLSEKKSLFLGYTADQTKSSAQFGACHSRYFGVRIASYGFYPGKRVIAALSKSVRCLYRIRITIGDQRIYPCDNGYIQSQGSE